MKNLSLRAPGPGASEKDVKEMQTRLLSKLVADGHAFRYLRGQNRQEVELLVQQNVPGSEKWRFPMPADGLIVNNKARELVAAVVIELQVIGTENILRATHLVVSSEARGQGLGTVLLSMLGNIPQVHDKKILQTTGLTSGAAIAPLRRAGFTVEEASTSALNESPTASPDAAIPAFPYKYSFYM